MATKSTSSVEIVTEAPVAMELQSVSTAELRAQLHDAIGLTEAAIVRVAAIWSELSRRGEDLSGVRFSLARFMLRVARGQLLPGLVVALSGQTRALERIAELPLDDQKRLAAGDALEIYRGQDRIDTAPLASLTYSEIALAIRDGRIRTAAEQRMAFERVKKARSRRMRGRPPKITVLPDNLVRIGNVEVPAERLLAEMRAAGLV